MKLKFGHMTSVYSASEKLFLMSSALINLSMKLHLTRGLAVSKFSLISQAYFFKVA